MPATLTRQERKRRKARGAFAADGRKTATLNGWVDSALAGS